METKTERRAKIKRSRRENRHRQRSRKSAALPANPNWWWTPARASTVCDDCRAELSAGARIAYDSHGKRALCEVCADTAGVNIECRDSRKMRAAANERRAA